MLKSADIDNKDNKSPVEAGVSSGYLTTDEHKSDGSHEKDQHRNTHQEEKQRSADVDITQRQELDRKLKGDSANDETSLKQWREQHRQRDVHKKTIHETVEAFLQGISDDDKTFYSTESTQDTGSPHETADREFSAKPEAQPDSYDVASDEKKTQSFLTQESSSTMSSSDEEHSKSHDHLEDIDFPESVPAVEITANDDSVVQENFENFHSVQDEKLLKTEDSENTVPSEVANIESGEQSPETEDDDNIVSSEVTASGVESYSNEEERAEKETFHEDSSTETDAVHELAEGLHESSSYHGDDDEIQTTRRSDFGVLDEVIAGEHELAVTEDDQVFVEHDSTADNGDPASHNENSSSDFGSESDTSKEELASSTDEDVLEIPPAVASDDVDIVSDGETTGGTFSAFSNIFSVIDAVIDVVSHEPICMITLLVVL